MRIELKEFQERAVENLLKESRYSQNEARDGRPQAIILSSPTGSGKTIIITSFIEKILLGDESLRPNPEAVFLWLSHSPELNLQSRDKILAQSSIFQEHDLIIVEPPFSLEKFESGKIYFINTQKLGKDTLLTKMGDGREYTIWDTVENTTRSKPDKFYVIIDEAHRVMNISTREDNRAQTIIQKFIIGDPFVGLSPVKILIGISATPERFTKLIGSTRLKREISIPPSEVRESGLLKDTISLFCPEVPEPSDWTLLSESIKSWKIISDSWAEYCNEQTIERVDPILVIQVEDRIEGRITRTDLSQIIEILEREGGNFEDKELAHCFEDDTPILIGKYSIRKIDPSKIEHDPFVRIVFFKMALTTGWDCPRAEVMMSFRRAQDDTLIAQLVGRMVRTPLARRIEGNDRLNKVSLYLPHYSPSGLHTIIEKLNDPENAPSVDIEDGSKLVTLIRDPAHSKLFSLLQKIPSYYVEKIAKISNIRRLIKLSRQLTFDEIDPNAWEESQERIIKILSTELDRRRTDPAFIEQFRENQTIEIREVQIEAGDWKEIDASNLVSVTTTPENIDNLFESCGRMLGEGLHKKFWSEKSDRSDPQKIKLELFGLLQDRSVWEILDKESQTRIESLFTEHRDAISTLRSSKRDQYDKIRRRAKKPEPIALLFPKSIEITQKEPLWKNHLYINDSGTFGWNANTWERAVLTDEMDSQKFIAWLRNFDRKQWSLCIPYTYLGEDKPCYPDLIVFRKDNDKIKVDLLDPHNPGLPDSVAKAVGLARYAQEHGDYFGRIELIIVRKKGEIKRLDVNKESIRDQVLKIRDASHLEALFEING